jgi:elongation factor P
MGIRATELKNGQPILVDGEVHFVVSQVHTKPGKGGAYIQAKLKKLSTGQILDRRFRSAETVEPADIEKKTMPYSYTSGGQHWFMDPETFEQVPVQEDLIGAGIGYLKSGTECQISYHEGRAITVDLPITVDLAIKEAPPVIRGATATSQTKPATLETGIVVAVPAFVETGEKIRVDTRTGKYVERVK